MNASTRTRSRDTIRFFIISSSLHDGDREHDVQRVHILTVGRVGGDFGEIFEREALLSLDDREGRGVDAELAGAFRGAAVYLERDGFSAREAVVAADLVRAVRHLDAGDPHGAAFGVVRYPGVFRREHGAVNDLDGQRRGDSDVNCAVLVVHGERDRHGGRSRAGRMCAEREAEREGEDECACAFGFQVFTPLYYRVVVIKAPLQGLCYTVRDAVDW